MRLNMFQCFGIIFVSALLYTGDLSWYRSDLETQGKPVWTRTCSVSIGLDSAKESISILTCGDYSRTDSLDDAYYMKAALNKPVSVTCTERENKSFLANTSAIACTR